MWIIFIILFAFTAECSPIPSSPHEHDITETVNSVLSDIFRSFQWNSVYFHVRNNTDNNFTTTVKSRDVKFENGSHFYNITSKFQSSPTMKIRLQFHDNLTATCEMIWVSIKAYFQDSDLDYFVATNLIPLNFTLSLPKLVPKGAEEKPIRVDYHNFNQYEIKLRTNGYDFKPNEENRIKQEFKTYLKSTLYEKINSEWKTSLLFLGFTFIRALGEKKTIIMSHPDFYQNEQSHYYFINSIPSSDYTLNNVIIKGLWNFRGIALDFSNPAAFPEIQVSDVEATMVQSFRSGVNEDLELSFRADNVYTSADQEAGKINVRAEGYLVKQVKSNTTLSADQSKLIVQRIESAIAASIKQRIPNFFEMEE